MANELNIGVKFGAEGIPEVSKSITQLDAQLKRFQKGLNDATGVDSISRLNRAIEVTKTRMDALRKFTGDAGGALGGKVVVGANQATNALTNLSRIAQDAPFGFIGITNNINPLLESFQRLKAETGSTGGALKALVGSLSGAAGLGLAVGIGSALLTVFGDKLFGFGRASKKAKEEADELAKTIRAIGDIQAEAIGSVQGQIAQVTALAAAISDSNTPYEQRKRALEELKQLNKSYFNDLQLEDAATGKLAKTLKDYTDALINSAIQKEFINEITKVATEVIKQDRKIEQARLRLADANKKVEEAQKRTAASVTEEQISANAAAAAAAIKKQTQALTELRAENEKSTTLLTQEALLRNEINKAVVEGLKFKDLDTKGSEKEVDLLSKRLAALEKIKDATKDLSTVAGLQQQIFDLQVKITLRDAAKNGLSKEEVDLAIRGFQDQLNEAFDKETLSLESIPKVKFSRVEIVPLETTNIESAIAKAAGLDKKIPIESDRAVLIRLQGLEFVLAQEEAQRAVERLRETVLNGVQDIISTSADAFGQILSSAFSGQGIGEGLAKAAQSLLSGIGGVLQEIGKQVIATSTAIKALKEALKTLIANPVAGIGIGIGLIALGGLLKNIKIPGFASGVNNFSGGLALVGERGPELVNLPRGSDVIPNHMLGGQQPIILQPSLEVGIDTLRVRLNKQDQRRNRI